ncbi:MAG TPA: response regulator [Dongiaceae bacterium]|jgi:PAS domain S-box-containing protein|nr:response regulator [Dongiaceae bacterium]
MKSGLFILNLEDNVEDAELNRAMIAARWPDTELVRVDRCEDFLQALETGRFDLILSDYTMPGFDGQTALKLAREKRPDIPFLFVSGTIGEDTAIEALKNGATDYVLKHRLVRLIPAVARALHELEERRQREWAEKTMRESEYKYRKVFECLGDAAFLADEQTGKIIDTNPSAEKLLGGDRTQILGHKMNELMQVSAQENTTDTAGFVCAVTRFRGSPLPVRVRTTKLTLHGRPLVLRLCHEANGR